MKDEAQRLMLKLKSRQQNALYLPVRRSVCLSFCLTIIILRKHLKMMDENYRFLQRMQIRKITCE